ncbi:hypothetical protein RFI_04205 [Reticulomyxa filosa]|uniref:Uncharacterized protein n=1 Tax=Reticulomyxa filosa TaxID=46433 RepID=X6P404_RETFI|nr:hypothetical protein RFI_04205 [Reticulomyxa filosa]|eukprot:ETO32911.1 hypothetical protein RFI_04205 [Reticulomyxa filosa]
MTKHFNCCTNLSFHQINICEKDFSLSEWIQSCIDKITTQHEIKDPIVIVVGTHLCGDLSKFLITAFNECDKVWSLLLVPCCFPRKKIVVREAKAVNVLFVCLFVFVLFLSLSYLRPLSCCLFFDVLSGMLKERTDGVLASIFDCACGDQIQKWLTG